MENVRLILKRDKKIRGKELKEGTPVFEFESLAGLKPADVEKMIQLQEVRVVEVKGPAPEKKPTGSK